MSYDAFELQYKHLMLYKMSRNAISELVKILLFAIRHPAWENRSCVTNLPGIFRIAICYRSPTIDSFRRSSRLSCIVFVGAIGLATMLLRARIFLDPRQCVTGQFSTTSPRRPDWFIRRKTFCKPNLFS